MWLCLRAQVGWCSRVDTYSNPSYGVGDDATSWSYCGQRCSKFHGDGGRSVSGSRSYGTRWNDNDVIGMYIDVDSGTISFSRNGEDMGVCFEGVKGHTGGAFFPAVSYSNSAGGCAFNPGRSAFRYPPVDGWRPWVEALPTASPTAVAPSEPSAGAGGGTAGSGTGTGTGTGGGAKAGPGGDDDAADGHGKRRRRRRGRASSEDASDETAVSAVSAVVPPDALPRVVGLQQRPSASHMGRLSVAPTCLAVRGGSGASIASESLCTALRGDVSVEALVRLDDANLNRVRFVLWLFV
jgi:hypothetical protein